MKKLTSTEIRKIWLDFFKSKNHHYIKSVSLVPINDESILWINSGVATLKKYFSGQKKPPASRLVNIQKSLRTNDIENIGITSRHHTFFEMLGNFSIGDYFKKEAINYAWELLTSPKYFAIPKDKLFITVFKSDSDAYKFWLEVGVLESHIIKMGRTTNFWDMGTGPCGPSSEIFFDKGNKYSTKNPVDLIKYEIENDRCIEIWNIVFSQFNNDGKNNYHDLPQKNIDTGAGLERLASCFQNTPTNFETDLFLPLINEIQKYTNKKYLFNYVPEKLKQNNNEQFVINSYFKIIADFTRAITFAIADGVLTGPNGRGYVIRRLIRKTMLINEKLGIDKLIITKIAKKVIQTMQKYYPELKKREAFIYKIITNEEKQFIKTLKKGIEIFENATNTKEKISNFNEQDAFMLFETYGLPLELIFDLASQKKIDLNEQKIEKIKQNFANLSKKGAKKTISIEIQKKLFPELNETNFVGYTETKAKAIVIAVMDDLVVFDKTPFYATSGGQECDFGTANNLKVVNVFKNMNKVFIHEIPDHKFQIGDEINLKIDVERRKNITKNHSATHLLFKALENVFSYNIPQVGSKTEANFLRFDILIQENLNIEKIKEAESIANNWVKNNTTTKILNVSKTEAKKMKATFLENVNYEEIVRVVKLNNEVVDLCGGTHVKTTGEIEKILITSFKKRGTGIYRIEAITGRKNIAEFIKEENVKYLATKLEILDNEIKKINIKHKTVFKSNLKQNYLETLNKKFGLKTSDDNFKQMLDDEIKQIDDKLKIIDEKITIKLKHEIENTLLKNNKYLNLKFKNINFKIIDKLVLKLINQYENKVLIITLINGKNMTVAVFLTPDLKNDGKIITKITFELKKYNLQGGGKNQLFVFGGEYNSALNIKEVISSWE